MADGLSAGPSINEIRAAAKRTDKELTTLREIAGHAVSVIRRVGLETAVAAVDTAVAVAGRELEVVFFGEFKSGKTTVVNGLLGQQIIPTDMLASAGVPVSVSASNEVRHEAVVLDEENHRLALAPVNPAQFGDLARLEHPEVAGNRVDHLRTTLDHPLLGLGLRLVDTPGLGGGLASTRAGRVIQQLHGADIAVLVTDSSQELSATELELVAEAQRHCPATLVVMTRTDLYPDWTRILERNEQHLRKLATRPPILAVGAGLQQLSARLQDRAIERESGFPLLWWFLALKLLPSARYHGVVAATGITAGELAAARRIVGERLDAMASVENRRKLEQTLAEATAVLGELSKTWQVKLRSRKRDAASQLSRDLEQRSKLVREDLRLQVAQAESPEEWPAIEGAAIAGINRLYAEHLLAMDEVFEQLFAGLVADLGIERSAFAAVHDPVGGELRMQPSIDQPDLDPSGERLQRSVMLLRSSSIGGSVGLSGLGFATALGASWWLFALPMVGVAAGAGGLIGVRVLNRMQRGQQIDRWRTRAQHELDRFFNDSVPEIRRHTVDVLEDLQESIDLTVPELMDRIVAAKAQEAKRLQDLVQQARSRPDETEESQRVLLQRFELIEAHLERLAHRLQRPDMAVYQT